MPPSPSSPSSPPARASIAVASGKGGVGKSTFSLNLAVSLAQRGWRVGVLDADLYGPDIPLMVNLTRRVWIEKWELWSKKGRIRLDPVTKHGVAVMSTGFLLGEDQPLALSSTMMGFLVDQLLHNVAWGELDLLVIDLPPGTADVQQHLLRNLQPTGVLVVVTPQDLAHLDAKKVVSMVEREGVRVLGGVENMASLRCPCCDHEIEVFPEVPLERSIWASGVRRLARLPLDPALARAAEHGRPFVLDDAIPATALLRALADELVTAVGLARGSDADERERGADAS